MGQQTPFLRDLKVKQRYLVSLNRRRIQGSTFFGFVVDYSDMLVLLHSFNSTAFCLTGYEVVRQKDIDSYCFFDDPRYWRVRAMRRLKIKPVKPSGISLCSIRDLLASLTGKYPLIGVGSERAVGKSVEFVGPIVSMAERTFKIEDSDYFGRWTGPHRMKYDEVTNVCFDDGYLRASALTHAKWKRKH